MNKIFLIGNLTKDPEIRETANGTLVCGFSIAVSRDYTTDNGERAVDFFNIKVWKGRAEICGKYLKKGNKVGVVGSLQTRSYEDKDGIKRTSYDIVANEVEFLTPKNSGENEQRKSIKRPQIEQTDIELPF